MSSLISLQKRLQSLRNAAVLGGGKSRIAKQHSNGKLTARERINLLADPGTFREYDQLVTQRCVDFGMQSNPDSTVLVMVLLQVIVL